MSRGHEAWLSAIIFAASQVFLPQANAALTTISTSSNAQTFATGTWSLVPIATATSANNQTPLVISSVSKGTNSWTYFWVKNFGTLQTLSLTMTNSTALTSGSGAYSVIMNYCTVPSMNTAGTCSGGSYSSFSLNPTNTNPAPNQSLSFTLAPGQTIQFREQYSNSKGNVSVSSTISVAVTRGDVRTATTTNG